MTTAGVLAAATSLAIAGMVPDPGMTTATEPALTPTTEVTAPAAVEPAATVAAPPEVVEPLTSEAAPPVTAKPPAVAPPAVPEPEAPTSAVTSAASPQMEAAVTPVTPPATPEVPVPVVAETAPAAMVPVVAPLADGGEASTHRFGIAFMGGQCDSRARAGILAIDLFSGWEWCPGGKWYQTPYLELMGAYWSGHPGWTKVDSLKEAGLTALVRTVHHRNGAVTPYLDLGIGINYISEDRIENKLFGSDILFGSNAGVGVLLGETGRVDVGLRVRHLSNAGMDDINWGINFYMLRLGVNL